MLSQLIKTGIFLLQNKKINLKRLSESGGMPSAHSALGCSVAIATVQEVGFASPIAALALTFAAVVLYDAMGVRRAAGEQAKAINQIADYLEETDKTGKMAEIKESISKSKEELFNLRFQKATSQLENSSRIRAVKTDIARMYTVLRERELGITQAPEETSGKAEK